MAAGMNGRCEQIQLKYFLGQSHKQYESLKVTLSRFHAHRAAPFGIFDEIPDIGNPQKYIAYQLWNLENSLQDCVSSLKIKQISLRQLYLGQVPLVC